MITFHVQWLISNWHPSIFRVSEDNCRQVACEYGLTVRLSTSFCYGICSSVITGYAAFECRMFLLLLENIRSANPRPLCVVSRSGCMLLIHHHARIRSIRKAFGANEHWSVDGSIGGWVLVNPRATES